MARWRRLSAAQVVAGVLLLLLVRRVLVPSSTTAVAIDASQPCRVERVIDGDTLVLEGGIRIRLIGIDAPELRYDGTPDEPFAREAADYLRRQVAGEWVRVELDRNRVDPYDRVLAYLFVDDRLLNEDLVREGLARVIVSSAYRSDRQRIFLQAERLARAEGRGLWSAAKNE